MSRILFVDDESDVLEGIRMSLRRERHRWTLHFALGATAALAELQRALFDLIVSDLRMPGMDGAELLARAQATQPGAARVVLSGNADQAMLDRACSQWLSLTSPGA
jgi:CheY-like chemotaxis protein